VSLQFDQAVDAFANSIDVRSATGKDVTAGPTRTTDSGREVVVPLRKLPKGAYTVRWHVTSNEGHVVSGVYTFGVRVKPPPPTEAYGAGGPTKFEYVAKWGYFVGLALLVGGLAFRLLVLRGRTVTPALERRFYWIVGAGVVGSIELGILGFILRAADAFQLPLDQLIYGDLSSRWSRDSSSWRGSPTGRSCSGPRSSSGSCSAPGSRSRGTRPWTSGHRGSRSSPTTCTSSPRASGSGAW
jgi:hypothetical protein